HEDDRVPEEESRDRVGEMLGRAPDVARDEEDEDRAADRDEADLDRGGEERLAEAVLDREAPQGGQDEEGDLARGQRVVAGGREIGGEHADVRGDPDPPVGRERADGLRGWGHSASPSPRSGSSRSDRISAGD